ncbi:Tripartite-type tricarboxylate transporter, receptor component TctC [Alteribacillus persepolensis]|uniref:Tripartite-type tricarboxylate transporter, receptor component TctC n=1 Tax=Alteribacillus persepolensis TaxID=568899 RepID=A0A1G8ALC4_9BACI|nr:tripartite tricarboxylate transporter substrate binding protein [Alteribacillus persepolensis]SDH21754.1 Tripartite-type tricarboxylate transporter, receptor component TctC [Alteribacillus persepolensis]
MKHKLLPAIIFILSLGMLVACSGGSTGGNTSESAQGSEGSNASNPNFPEQPITWIVPFDSGSVTDLATRFLADEMSQKLDTSIVIENVPGGGTVPAHVQVSQSNPDGYTVGTGALAAEITLHQQETAISDLNDLDVIAQIGEYTNGISVRADSDVETLDDLENVSSDQLSVAPSASRSITHLWWDLVAEHYGIGDYGLLSTTGGNDAVLKLLSGDADVVSTPLANVVEHVNSGDVRTLAVTTNDRVPGLEDVPTLDELGVDNPLIHNLLFIAPNDLPDDVRNILLSTLEEVMNDPEVQEEMEKMQLAPAFLKGEELEEQMNEGREAIGQIMDANN